MLCQEFRTGCPWELLYANDLVLVAETIEELVGKFEKWKTGLEDKGLRVNAAKTKVMISNSEARSGFEIGRWPCGVCRKGVGSNSIFCQSCKHWVHRKCSSISGKQLTYNLYASVVKVRLQTVQYFQLQ